MLHRVLTAMALVFCAVATPSHAHPLVPGLAPAAQKTAPARKEVHRRAGGDVVALAERYVGTNPTEMRRLWCANFVGLMEKKVGRAGTGSNMARSYDSYGRAIKRSEVRRGDIAVMKRRGGGHVGYFVEWAPNGKAVLISGNSRGGKVAKGQYPVSRIYAWRRPSYWRPQTSSARFAMKAGMSIIRRTPAERPISASRAQRWRDIAVAPCPRPRSKP
jgi:uncharacterized protein (TIGR02594 family)